MKRASVIMIIGSILLLGAFVFPLWNIELGAPQYPDPLGMNIYITGIQGQNEFDIQNIDGLNHYIGMKTLPKPEDMWEFRVFPMVNAVMTLLGILIGILAYRGKLKGYYFLVWFVLMTVLSALGIYDFNLWMIDYGTNLDPHAILKLQNPDGTPMSYKPPLLGHIKLLNFDAYSYPRMGAILMFGGTFLTFIAYLMSRMSNKVSSKIATLALVVTSSFLLSCKSEVRPINYGEVSCDFCRMTVVDKIHGAEIISDKGKVYTFDAVECMVNFAMEKSFGDESKYLTNHYREPSELIDATEAFFLISPDLPSPMGANLTALPDKASADEAMKDYHGELLNWEELRERFN